MPYADPDVAREKARERVFRLYHEDVERAREKKRRLRAQDPERYRAIARRHWERNAEAIREKERVAGRARYQKKAAWLRQRKGNRCWDCDGKFASHQLHFHHRDPATKLFNVAAEVRRRRSLLEAEIAKCDVLCALCHSARHRASRVGG